MIGSAEKLAEKRQGVEIVKREGISPVPDYLTQFSGILAFYVADMLEQGAGPTRASQVAEDLGAVIARSMEKRPVDGVKCKKGCYYCCQSHQLTATAPEWFHAMKAVRAAPGDQRETMIEQITSSRSLSREDFWDADQACPLLIDKVCSVHGVRPLSCRYFTSVDLDACLRAFNRQQSMTDPIPTPWGHAACGMAAKAGIRAGLMIAGLPHHAYEAVGALQVLLERDDAEEAWLNGEDIFAGVLTDAPEDDFNQFVEASKTIALS